MTIAAGVDESELAGPLRRGMVALREQVPHAVVAVLHNNFALIDLGTIPKADLELYTSETARLFARVPLTFPSAEPYGLVTAPFLSRKNGAIVERQHLNHENATVVVAYLGERLDLGFWSWNWSGMPLRRPEDLVALLPWALKRIREG